MKFLVTATGAAVCLGLLGLCIYSSVNNVYPDAMIAGFGTVLGTGFLLVWSAVNH